MGEEAFGSPGGSPTWASSDKDFVTTALGNARIWVTVGHGIINEIYWPSTGRPEIRDLGFYLLGENRWVDLKRVKHYRLSRPKPYLPLLTIVHMGDDYRLTVEVLPDPRRDVLLLRYDLEGPYRLAILAAPHLGESGYGNTAWVDGGDLYASVVDRSICITADVAMTDQSVGYVGASDGWQDLTRHGRFTFGFSKASCGNVAMSASLTDRRGVIAVGGRAGDAAGVSMIAGPIVIGGETGIRYGPGMRRGSIILLGADAPDMLPTYRYSGTYQPTILRVLLRHLSQRGWSVPEGCLDATYHRYHGDFLEFGKGEILYRA